MSLELWFRNQWIDKHQGSPAETRKLLQVVDRDLRDAGVVGLSDDARFLAAYNASLTVCRIALLVSGYKVPKGANQHYRTIDSLPLTLGQSFKETRDYLDQCRRRRNVGFYEQVGIASKEDVEELCSGAQNLREALIEWLRSNHPSLLTQYPD